MQVPSDGVRNVRAGELMWAKAMLYTAGTRTAGAIFMNFSRRALKQEYQKKLESFLCMALKAQNQCSMTLETLATIKNPPVVFARQANIANGPQQVINGVSRDVRTDAGAHATNSSTEKTELLEMSDGQGLDTGAAGTAGQADPHLETVGAVHRPAHR